MHVRSCSEGSEESLDKEKNILKKKQRKSKSNKCKVWNIDIINDLEVQLKHYFFLILLFPI